MIISQDAVNVLANFSTINQSIVIHPGSVLRTMNPGKTIFARASIPDEFDNGAAIYDLSKFLGIISLTDSASNVEFKDKLLEIRQGKSFVKYAYCPEDMIASPPRDKEIKMGPVDVSFTLQASVWKEVSNAMRIMGFSEFAFIGTDGKLSIQALTTKVEGADTYSTELGDCNIEFKAIIDAEKMKLIPGDYVVEVSKKGLAHFKGETVEYWIAISTKSEFEE